MSADVPFVPVPPSDLDDWLADDAALIVDIRPPAAFSSARVPRAVALSVPSTLLKRPLFSLERLTAMLSSPSARSRFSSWASASRILVYDADSTAIGDSSNINGLLRKFNAGGFHGQLAWLRGGFYAIWRDRRDIVDAAPPTPEVEIEEEEDSHDKAANPILQPRHLPMAAFSLSSTTHINLSQPNAIIGASLPTSRRPPGIARSISSPPNTNTLHPAFNPFFDTVRQNTELSQGITERIPLRLPHRVRRRIHELPFRWLRDIARRAANAPPINKIIGDTTSSSDSEHDSDSANPADIEEGKEALAMQFFKIELSEQRRLMGIMEHHSKESGHATDKAVATNPHPFPFSITAGVEKGAKNRYRHIWPFEHARVRLHQGKHADDDYINASYIQPIGTKRRYIATQGPLPATYTDFWTLCWEQNVQVIVMLTREVEGAMVKCGPYWSDTDFGTLRLRLISTEGVAVSDDRPASAGFFGSQSTLALRNHRPKTQQIYPHSAGSHRRYKHHHYHNNRSETVKRIFELSNTAYPEAKPRRIIHFQYLDWPDMNIPDDPRGVLGLIKQVEEAVKETHSVNYSWEPPKRGTGKTISVMELDEKTGIATHALANSPVLLHCSAGVGRTGGFIAVDAILDAIRREVRGQRESNKSYTDLMDVDKQKSSNVPEADPVISLSSTMKDPGVDLEHVPTTPSISSIGQQDSCSDPEAAFTFPAKTSQWAQDVSQETGISGSAPPQTSPPGFNFTFSATPSSTGGSSQTFNSLGSFYNHSSSSPLGTSVSGASSSSKVNHTVSIREITSPLKHLLSTEHSIPDQRLRTVSAPSGTRPPFASNLTTKYPTLPLPRDHSPRPKHPAERILSNLPLVSEAPAGRKKVSSEGEQPLRSESPLTDEASLNAHASSVSGSQPRGPLQLQSAVRLNSEIISPEECQKSAAFDYKDPRPLHETFTPPPLSSFEEPIWEVVQDMREQRMSLCQSLRQYVFVHAAIIEGSLIVIDEESEIADGLVPRQEQQRSKLMASPMPVSPPHSRSPSFSLSQTAHLHTHSAESVDGSSSSSYPFGKRPSTPTELLKEDKEGEVMLAKRPSIKRKQTPGDPLDHAIENIRYQPIPMRAPSSVVHAGGISAPSTKVLPP